MDVPKNIYIPAAEPEDTTEQLPAIAEADHLPAQWPPEGKPSFWQRLPRFKDAQQKRAGRNLVWFFILILVLTLVARGTAGATLPKVETTRAESGEIVQRARGTGTVKPGGSTTVEMPDGLTIKEVPVSPGQSVEAGDALALFDVDELAEQLKRATTKLEELELKRQQLQRTSSHDGSSLEAARTSLARAQQDYDSTKAQGEADIVAAQQALEDARQARKAAREHRKSIADKASEAYAAADADVKAKEADVPVKEEALAQAKSRAESNLVAAARALEDAQAALARAEATDAEARQQESDTAAQNNLEISTLLLDIAAQQKTVDALQALADNGGRLLADKAGTLQEVPQAGMKSGADAPFRLADADSGFEVELWLDKKEAEKLTPGDSCEVVAAGGSMYYRQMNTGRVTKVDAAGDDGRAKVTVRLLDGEWKSGQTVEIQAVQDRQKHSLCVPLSALHASNEGYYILVLQQTSTVLGTEYVAAKVPVTVKAQDEQMAAVEGAFSDREDIISGSDKAVQPGDSVRVAS